MEKSAGIVYQTTEMARLKPSYETISDGRDERHETREISTSPPESLVDRLWLFELLAWIICASGLIGLAITLAVTQNHPIPQWTAQRSGSNVKLTVTINSVISIFSTLIKSTLLIPVVASLHQLKWIWFKEDRPLADVKLFEGAGKGPLGSVILFWRLRGKSLACLGAIITIASLGVDFTLQQLVTYPLRPAERGVAQVGTSKNEFI
jgi:hypothetical protein